MTNETVKRFWVERAKNTGVPRIESQVNFENDAKMADLRVKSEIELIRHELVLSKDDILVDLGAGNGRFSMLFAPLVKKVIAVEYVKDFTVAIENQAKEKDFDNIEILNQDAEEFCSENLADVVFVSGLLNYLDQNQYNSISSNIYKTLKPGGILFLREPISILESEYLVDKYSEELGTHYYSLYRTGNQHIKAFSDKGLVLSKFEPFFEDGSVLNKRSQTRHYYFVFLKRRYFED